MATNHVLRMLINRTFEEISLAFSGKTTAMSLSIEIKRRLPMETTKETSGRKWASLHRMFPSSHGRSTFQEFDPEMISTILTVMMVKGIPRSDTAMLKTK